ncbi:MAG: GNAT family N-acetyltransferase [Oscillospiraceae bacterium]
MEFSFRIIDCRELNGFRSYLTAETAALIENKAQNVLAVGAVTGRNACGAAAALVNGSSAEITDLFVDKQIRSSGAGSFLMDILLDTLLGMGITEIGINYVMSSEDASKLGSILKRRGFSEPVERSRVYKAQARAFSEADYIEEIFGELHRSEYELKSFAELAPEILSELESDSGIQSNLSWRELKSKADTEISSALIRNGRVEMYFLCRQTNRDFVILSANSRENALAGDFYFVFTDMMTRCEKRIGSKDYNLCFSAVGTMVKRVVGRLPRDKVTEYVEMISDYKA